jgi:hypothetical protein
MEKRAFKIKLLEAYRDGIITNVEFKDLLDNGFRIAPIAWTGTEEKHSRILRLLRKVFELNIPNCTWTESEPPHTTGNEY